MPSPAPDLALAPDAAQAGIVNEILQRGIQLATLPGVALEIIRLAEQPDTTVDDMNKVILNDPALGIRILKLVNCSYYGMPGQIKSIHRGIQMLGLKAIKNIAIAASLTKLFRGGHLGAHFDAGDLWTHSLAVAAAAQMLAGYSNICSTDEAFLAGLIHDTGILTRCRRARWNSFR
jgi:HD-like signal output (HDOD) protein